MKKIALLIALFSLTSTASAVDRSVRIKELQTMRSEKRVALVIGNGDYKSSPLKNPVNDARLVAKELKDLSFTVTQLENANLKQMMMAVNDFGKQIKGGGVGLFYYAGHGMQANGRNYLIPVGADINSESEIEFEAVDAGRVLAKMEDAGNRVNIMVLDACRDNPFSRGWRSTSRGLAQLSAPAGSYIAYAAKPGMVAADGEGRNGVFTEEFVKAVREDGLEINDVFRQVRSAVMKRTDKKQVPHTEETVTGHFYFRVPQEGGEESNNQNVSRANVQKPTGNIYSNQAEHVVRRPNDKYGVSKKNEQKKDKGVYTVEEIYEKRNILHNEHVVVTGKVVKANQNLLNRNWLHIQDGTGNPRQGTNNLVVTTNEPLPTIGAEVRVKGILSKGKDFGAGYGYKAIIENATIQVVETLDSGDTGTSIMPAEVKSDLGGRVVEIVNGGGYSYIRVDDNGLNKWIAVPETQVSIGTVVYFKPGQQMKDFSSKTLNRTFDLITFSAGIVD